MSEAPEATTHPDIALLRRVPLIVAAIVSLATVILALVWLVVGAFVVAGAGLALVTLASTRAQARRASTVVSIGFGLAVGPAVYLLLAVVVEIAG